MNFNTPPYLSQNVSVQRVMLQVLAALLPGIAVYAWLIGPIVLVQVANTLRASSAGHGVLARHGGEEFAWVMPGVDLDQALLQCEYLREAVKFASAALPVTISIGVAMAQPGDTVSNLLQRADTALYAAKHAGRDRVMAG